MTGRSVKAWFASLLLVAGAGMIAACDPCFGTQSCGATEPRLVVEGQMVRAEDGGGVDGITLDLIRRSGVALDADSVSVTTSGGGFWRVETGARSAGSVTFDVRVHTPALPHPYTIAAQTASTVSRAGDAVIMDRWVSNPYVLYYGDVFLRANGQSVGSDHSVEFHRRGQGAWLTGSQVADTVAYATTDVSGRAKLFAGMAFVTDTGVVRGDLIVRLWDPIPPSTIRDVRLRPQYKYHADGDILTIIAGPNLDYAIQVFDRATGKALAGVPFNVVRTGGIPLQTAATNGVTDRDGYARLNLTTLTSGSVNLAITFHRTPTESEQVNLSAATFEDPEGRLLANVNIGPYLNYYGLLRSGFDHPLAGVPVRVRQTGGVSVTPSDTTVLTDASGAFAVHPVPSQPGTATFELTFLPPAPQPHFQVRNVVLSTMQRDVPQGQVIWVWDVNVALDGPPGSTVVRLP